MGGLISLDGDSQSGTAVRFSRERRRIQFWGDCLGVGANNPIQELRWIFKNGSLPPEEPWVLCAYVAEQILQVIRTHIAAAPMTTRVNAFVAPTVADAWL